MTISIIDKYQNLENLLRQYGNVAVAFSGGADSYFLLSASCKTLGVSRVRAFHASSILLSQEEDAQIVPLCDDVGCEVHNFNFEPLSWPEFTANPPDRCYLCKKKIYQTFKDASVVREGGFLLLDGTNFDDLSADRPGLKAIREFAVQTPLADVGLTKKEIRRLSRDMGLGTWDKPSASCFATRITAGIPIDVKKINFIEQGEKFLTEIGCGSGRVCPDQAMVKISVPRSAMERVREKSVISAINDYFGSLGIIDVWIDPVGREDVEI